MEVAVKLEIFEGPLDLLLHLIRKNEVDIHEIPIATITHQYLEYLGMMRELNITLAGEFLVMASTLTHIKSRSLLPSQGSAGGQEDDDDPMVDLVEQLREHLRFKTAADSLEARSWLERDVFARGGARGEVAEAEAASPEKEVIVAGVFDLVSAFSQLLRSRGDAATLKLPRAGISMEDRMGEVLDLLKRHESLLFSEIFPPEATREELVVTFLALLELMRVGLMRAYQERSEPEPGKPTQWSPLRLFYQAPEEEGAA